jgi:hypothetical protein
VCAKITLDVAHDFFERVVFSRTDSHLRMKYRGVILAQLRGKKWSNRWRGVSVRRRDRRVVVVNLNLEPTAPRRHNGHDDSSISPRAIRARSESEGFQRKVSGERGTVISDHPWRARARRDSLKTASRFACFTNLPKSERVSRLTSGDRKPCLRSLSILSCSIQMYQLLSRLWERFLSRLAPRLEPPAS